MELGLFFLQSEPLSPSIPLFLNTKSPKPGGIPVSGLVAPSHFLLPPTLGHWLREMAPIPRHGADDI